MAIPFDPNPTVLWSLPIAGKVASCSIRFVRIDVEVRIFRNDALLVSRIFQSGGEALAWAQEQRRGILLREPCR